MDAIAKMLKKMTRKEKSRVLAALREVKDGTLTGVKLTGKNEYRIRVGNYRIIYHLEHDTPVVDHVRRRNEKTYK